MVSSFNDISKKMSMIKPICLAAALFLSLTRSAISAPLPVSKLPCFSVATEEVSLTGETYCSYLEQRIIRTVDEQGEESAFLTGSWNQNGFEIFVSTDNSSSLLLYNWDGSLRFPHSPPTIASQEAISLLPKNDWLASRSMWLSFVMP